MNSKRLLNTFFELVKIDSPSRSEAQVAAYCENVLKKLGFSVTFDQSEKATGSDTGNIIAFLPGNTSPYAPDHASADTPGHTPSAAAGHAPESTPGHIILSAHMDCVDPCKGVQPVLDQGIVHSAGDTILGADDKAGIAAIFEAIQSLIEEGAPRPSISVLLTTCEELSLLGSGALSEQSLPEGAPCFVFDAGGAPGTIIVGAPFHYTLEAIFTGKAAHAGAEPEAGISAIQAAAKAIADMQLGRLDETTTANIGIVKGGHEVNVIPDRCMIKGECRSLASDRVEACKAQMTKACEEAAEQVGASVQLSWTLDYPGVLYDKDDALVLALIAAAQDAELKPQIAISGGGADANILAAKGVSAITLGIGMTSYHSLEEHISLEDLEGTARFAKSIIRHYA